MTIVHPRRPSNPPPGTFPYTRGVHPTMYSGRLWTMRQYSGFGTAEQTRDRFRYLLDQGQTGLSLAFDLPTQLGYDSDHSLAEGEVGRVGVAIDSLADFEVLFSEIRLDQVSTSMTINATAAILLSMYVAMAERQGVNPAALRGTVQNDVLKEYFARGTYIFPPQPTLRITRDIIAYATEHLPLYNPISVSGYHIREAGSTAAQEIAFTFADAIAYCEAALTAGLKIDEFAPRISFFFNAHNNLFEEIAKFRAARRLWARIVRDRLGAADERSCKLRFHAQTGGSTLVPQQPLNNIVRVAYQALAAILGGAQSLHTNSYDEALALPTEEAVEIALRTQQVLAYETGVPAEPDPLNGSELVESLTDSLEAEARSYLDAIDGRGGTIACIADGYFEREILAAAYRSQRQVESGEQVVVGVNRFVTADPPGVELLTPDPNVRGSQIGRLERVRGSRDRAAVAEALDAIERVACTDDNLMPAILAAVRLYATVGEISDRLRGVFGVHHPC